MDTFHAIKDDIVEKSGTLEGQGELVGDTLIGIASGGAAKAAKEAARAGKLGTKLQKLTKSKPKTPTNARDAHPKVPDFPANQKPIPVVPPAAPKPHPKLTPIEPKPATPTPPNPKPHLDPCCPDGQKTSKPVAPDEMRSPRFGKYVRRVDEYKHALDPDHVKAARIEKDGGIVRRKDGTVPRKPDGSPYDHLTETRENMHGARDRTILLKKYLTDPDLSPNLRNAVESELGELSKILDNAENALGELAQ